MNANPTPYKHGLYRSRHGVLFGVCRGVAEYLDFSVFWFRVILLALFFFTGIFPIVVIYFIAALVMKPEPVMPVQNVDDEEFYQSFATSRTMALHRLKRTFESLERRIQRMESIVTAREYDWDKRLNE